MKKLRTILDSAMEKETSLLSLVGAFLGTIAFRIFAEHFLARSPQTATYEILIEFLHDVYFFSISYLLLWILLAGILKVRPQKLGRIFLWGSLLIILPPLIDMARTQGAVFWSFYVLGGLRDIREIFLSFFGNLPPGIVYFGTKIIFFITILAVMLIIFARTKSYLKTALGTVGAYIALFFMGAFPTFFYFIYAWLFENKNIYDIRAFHIAQFFASPADIFGVKAQVLKYTFVYNLNFIYFPLLVFLLLVIFFLANKQKTISLVKNFRLPQLIYHSGMFFIGMGLGYLAFSQNFRPTVFSLAATFTLLISIWLSWIASVVVNDIYDFGIDQISNPARPLPQGIFKTAEYAHIGIACFLLALFGALSVGFTFAALIFMYQLLAWFYSAAPFRVKKYPVMATFISALATLIVMFVGYILMSNDQTVYSLSWRIILLQMITYTISLPIKDFKDIEGDKKYSVWTVPVVLGEKKARLVVAISIFTSYMLSVFFLNELDLFWWAVVFGSSSFLILNNDNIKPRELPAWILSVVSVYTLILTWVVFF